MGTRKYFKKSLEEGVEAFTKGNAFYIKEFFSIIIDYFKDDFELKLSEMEEEDNTGMCKVYRLHNNDNLSICISFFFPYQIILSPYATFSVNGKLDVKNFSTSFLRFYKFTTSHNEDVIACSNIDQLLLDIKEVIFNLCLK